MGKQNIIVGIDEVGRGPLAGPLAAAAVAIGEGFNIKGLGDSKALSDATRKRLANQIRQQAAAIGISWAANTEIDEFGLTLATSDCMRSALRGVGRYRHSPIVIDGKLDYLNDSSLNCRCVVGADAKYPAVMAASIIAKVARDQYMRAISQLYPQYGFEKHVGYGTHYHRQQIINLGPSPLHRLSFKPLRA